VQGHDLVVLVPERSGRPEGIAVQRLLLLGHVDNLSVMQSLVLKQDFLGSLALLAVDLGGDRLLICGWRLVVKEGRVVLSLFGIVILFYLIHIVGIQILVDLISVIQVVCHLSLFQRIIEFVLPMNHQLLALRMAARGRLSGLCTGDCSISFLGQDRIGSLLVLSLLLDSVLLRVVLSLLVQLQPFFASAADLLGSLLFKQNLSGDLGS